MSNQTSAFSLGYFSLSMIIHVAAVAAMLLLPQMQFLQDGSGHSIEFVAMQTPKGEQLYAPTLAENETVSTTVPPAPHNTAKLHPAPPTLAKAPLSKASRTAAIKPMINKKKPAAKVASVTMPTLANLKPESESLPENLDSEISTEAPNEKLATVLPDKIETEDAIAKDELVVQTVADDEDIQENYDDIVAEELESTSPEWEDQPLLETANREVSDFQQSPEKTEVTHSELAAVVAENDLQNSTLSEEDPQQITQDQTKASAAANPVTAAQVSQKKSSKDYGVASGKVRSYLDLRQVSGNRPPRYPVTARRQSQQGQVHLAYYVENNGVVTNLKLVKSSGYPLLDQEAIKAVSQYKYKPGQAGWTMHPIDFQLQGPVKKMPSRLRTSGRIKTQSYN